MIPEKDNKDSKNLSQAQKNKEQFLQQKKNFQKLKGNSFSDMNRKFYTQIRKRG